MRISDQLYTKKQLHETDYWGIEEWTELWLDDEQLSNDLSFTDNIK